MIGGSPSLRRSRLIVTFTTAENGSTASSQARASSSSGDTTVPARGEQQFEHGELLGGQIEPPAGAVGDPPARVERQIAAAHHRRERRLGAPRERADPRDQLGEGERLGQVVVGAQAEPGDAILDPADAVSISTRCARPRLTSVSHTRSPCTPGRSRSSTITS